MIGNVGNVISSPDQFFNFHLMDVCLVDEEKKTNKIEKERKADERKERIGQSILAEENPMVSRVSSDHAPSLMASQRILGISLKSARIFFAFSEKSSEIFLELVKKNKEMRGKR